MPTVRRAARVVLFAALALLLGACLRVEQNLTLNPDDTVDGTVTVAVSEELLELSGESAEDLLTQIAQGEAPVPGGRRLHGERLPGGRVRREDVHHLGSAARRIRRPRRARHRPAGGHVRRRRLDRPVDRRDRRDRRRPNDPTVQQMLGPVRR